MDEQEKLGDAKNNYVTKTLMRELTRKSRELMKKARKQGGDGDSMQSYYHTNRRSPGGPDPKHH